MSYYDDLGRLAQKNNLIEEEQYHYYHVKRGLRNRDGSGVLVGLTTVSSVLGYEKIDEEVVPAEGKLRYRGIDVGDLVKGFEAEERMGFDEVVYLLFFGELPNAEQLKQFSHEMGELRHLSLNFTRDVLQTFRTPDIMNALARSVLTLYAIDDKADDLSLSNQVRQAMELVAKMGVLVPYAYYSIQQAFNDQSLIIHQPNEKLSAAENLLSLIRADQKYTDLEARILDILLILHADHGGGNNSTFTTRVISSTNTDIYSAIAAALGSLKGPLHGGANVRAYNMMHDIEENVGNGASNEQVRDYLFKILKGETFDGQGKIYGMGHAVYTLSDPRTIILRDYARKLAEVNDREEDFKLHLQVEEQAPDVIREFKNNPNLSVSANVDFYSGFIYDLLGIPAEVYTPFFAVARVAGWCAHRIELASNLGKIMRPAYKTLAKSRQYVPMSERMGG